ncbi:MAG: ABC transporter ATP-binding protein [Planctomycetales bacterium]|nr:ABC transporter ATP-binding protein [Planctomycetales bacterium]
MFVATTSLTKRYRQVEALADCTLGIERGEVFGLLGPNGAGKTTLLRLLLGFLKPTSGSATIDTLDCYRDSLLVRSRVAYLPGEARMFRRLRGHDILAYFARLRPGASVRRARDIANRLGLDLARPVVLMSTGMRQKLALAVTLAPQTPLVILDEPTSSLDPSMRTEVSRLVREVRDEGRTVVFSSHVLSEVEAVCDRVAILRHGRLVHTQVMADLRRQHRITGDLTGGLEDPPPAIREQIEIVPPVNGRVTIDAMGELAPLLGWLSTLPLARLRIEPIGLQAVYDRFHLADRT